MAEPFRSGEKVFITNDEKKRIYTTGAYDGTLLIRIIPVEPIMQVKELYHDQNGNPYMNDKGQLAPKKCTVEDTTEIFINPKKLSRLDAKAESKKE